AEAGDLGHAALDEVADLEAVVDLAPRIVFDLLDAQADALVGLVDLEDLGFHFLALLEDFGGVVDLAGPTEVGHVDHAVNAFFQFHKRAVGGEVADLALDAGADREAIVDVVPRIGFELANAKADLALFFADAEHLRVDFLADGKHVRRTGD